MTNKLIATVTPAAIRDYASFQIASYIYFLIFILLLGYSQLSILWQFQVDSKRSQSYRDM